MERNHKIAVPVLLVMIVVLACVAYLLYTNPAILTSLPWMEDENPPITEMPPADEEPPVENVPPTEQPPVDEPTVDEPQQPPIEQPPADEPLAPIVTLSGSYYTYAQMSAQLAALSTRYSDILQMRSYGVSADGRDLYVATLGDPNAPRQIIITAGMHAREYVNCFVVMRQMEYYLEHYDTVLYGGKTPRELFSKVCLVIAPMTNPDGITLAQEGIDAIRSDALREGIERMARLSGADIDRYLNLNWKSNARGVDINRNFDILWEQYRVSASYTVPAFKEYKGENINSEPEARALVALTESLSDPAASICVHSQGNIIYWRCDPSSELWAENLRLAEITQTITGYQIIDENQTDAQTEPSYSNWTVFVHGIPTVTVENGVGGYPQHYGMADGFLNKNRDLWAAVALEYGAN